MGGLLATLCPCLWGDGVGLIGRPIRLPKETYAVPGTAVEIVATCKYDVTEDMVEWSRVILVKGKEKEEKIIGKDAKKKLGKLTIEDNHKITLTITKFGPKDSGRYILTVTKTEDGEVESATAETEMVVEDPKREKKIRAMFNDIDKDGSGDISNEELAAALRKANPGMDPADVDMMVRESDENGDGMVDYQEFSGFMKKAGL